MFVRDQDDITKEVKKTEITDGENFETGKTEYEINSPGINKQLP